MKKQLFITLIGIGASSLVFLGVKAFDLGSFIQNEYSAITATTSDLPSTTELGNIYDYAYNLAQKVDYESTDKGIKYLKDYINKKWNCSMSEKEITDLYSTTTEGGMFLALAQKRGKATLDDVDKQKSGFAKACTKLIGCTFEKPEQIDVSQYNSDSYVKCKGLIAQIYSAAKVNIGNDLSLKQGNIGDDMYYNGTLDDSSFDLLLDISEISKILFKSPLYPSESQFNPSSNTRSTTVGDYNNKKSLGGGNVSGSSTGSGANSSVSISSGLMENALQAQYANSAQNMLLDPTTGTTSSTNTQTVINSAQCISGYSYDPYAQYSSNGLVDSLYASGIYYANSQLTMDSDLLSGIGITGYNMYDYSQASSYASDLANTILSGYSNASVQPIASNQGKTYTKANTDLFRCTGNVDEDSILTIKMCGVKSKKKGVGGSLFARSIEEMIDEMNNMLVNMKEKGALMKHKHTDEFLETALQDIKLKDIFSFDIQVAYKPIFEKKSTEKEKKQKWKDFNENLEANALGNLREGTIKEEKNKYLIVWDPVREESKGKMISDPGLQNINLGFFEEFSEEKQPKTKDMAIDGQAKIFNAVLGEMKGFVEGNMKSWSVISEALGAVRKTSRSLQKKVEGGS